MDNCVPIVDDEPADLQLLAKDLELVSYEVLTAIDGRRRSWFCVHR